MPTLAREIGKRVVKLRSKQRLTQSQLAKLAGVSVRYVQMVESGRSDIRLSMLEKLAKPLQVEPAALLTKDPKELVVNSVPGKVDEGACGLCPLDAFPVGLQICDAEGLVWYTNARCEAIQGYSRAEVCGRMYIWDFVSDDEGKEHLKEYLKFLVASEPKPIAYSAVNMTKQGFKIRTRANWNYIRDAKGKVIGFFTVLLFE